jgi:uncharacterized protein YggU (UPF0235/DUF167 family)
MYIKVKVTADSKKEVFERVSDDFFIIKVKEKAENNRANKRVLELVGSVYPNKFMRIVSGHHSPSKIISIDV